MNAYDNENRTKRLWELHLYSSVARLPLYRGSDDYKTYILPIPYLIYRGDIFQADRGGLPKKERVVSIYSDRNKIPRNPPVNDDNTAREGMGDLDPIIEAGPAFKWFFLGRHPRKYLYLRPALRWIASVGLPDNLKTRQQGWRFLTNLIYQYEPQWGDNRWKFGANIGIDFADRHYHGYFYDVGVEDSLPGRPTYEADGGYSGFSLSGSVSYRLTDHLSLAVYGRWDSLAGAVYRDSPLVEDENNFISAAALNWNFLSSKKRVDSRYQEN